MPYIQSKASTHLDRVSGGLVRFNTGTTEASMAERDRIAQQTMAGLNRARSLRIGRKRRSSVRQDGEIIKMDSMLVRIEVTNMSVPEEYDENESLKVETRCADKWREYVVVCRECDDPDAPMALRLYKSRTIPAVDKQHVSSRSTREIPLNPKSTKANLYSSLDKTLVVWLPYRRGTLIYIMRPRCASTSVEWYSFLRAALGEPRCKSLQVAVPDLTLTITIPNPFDQEDHAHYNDEGEITSFEQKTVASAILKKSMDIIEGVTEWEDVTEHWKMNERMGLAWRRYDRLEWVHGVNEQRMDGSIAMQKTHELELRPKTHYPTESVLEDGSKMTEPPPVEGFLVRLTSARGRGERLGRKFQKKQYWATHDQYLCYCRPGRAQPPPPPPPSSTPDGTPLIYGVAPYKLDENGEIEWLTNPTPGPVEKKDEEAYLEAERKVNLMLMAEGFVDLVQAVKVGRVGRGTSDVDGTEDSEASAAAAVDADDDETCFEITLENGLVIRLQAFNSETRDEWIHRLSELITYWHARDREDLTIIRRTRDTNLKQLNMDEQLESLMGQFGRKWEVSSHTIASGEIFNVCGLSSCRTITMSGVLYRKPRRRATFRRYNVILCNGELIIFHHAHRNSTGKEVPTTLHEKHISLSLRDCYIYSGLVTEEELLYTNSTTTATTTTPGRSALPRIYRDGYTSTDEEAMTCFVLWHGSRRSIFTKRDEDGNKVRRRVTPLGQGGKSVVFKARSRLERDAWVMGIAMEIERLNLHKPLEEEVEVVEKKGFAWWKSG
ncbi:Pleckstrin homology domain-containing protein [Sphaerosporella brunnea]|uniref:Pleckstrin homology domain-containing protein n=1 Tax=Sphaerosporella brunnea TaxID=1250544 RepID=A0A5J5EK17_9PEZI|nr:Pleckstrin homology domain-containing protein [Sphaerosporella brunnea]